MNLMDKVKEFGHYAKKIVDSVKVPLTTKFAMGVMAAAFTIMPVSEAIGQSRAMEVDTMYSTGIFTASNIETNSPIEGVQINAWSDQVPMGNHYFSENYITNNNGAAEFELKVFVDSTTGNSEYYQTNTTVGPNPGSEINIKLPKRTTGTFSQYSNGQLVGIQRFNNTDEVYVDVSKQAAGTMTWRINTDDGANIAGKYVKANVPAKGPASFNKELGFKNSDGIYAANYWVVWSHPDYIKDSTEIEFEDGNVGFVDLKLTPINGQIPQHQDIFGIAKDEANNNAPLANVIAILYNQTLNQTMQITTGSNGEYNFEDVPVGSSCFISVGGLEDYYSWNDIEYTVPSTIGNTNDTIMQEASAVMHPVDPNLENFSSLIQVTRNGTQDAIRMYWIDPDIPVPEKTIYINAYTQYDALTEGHTHIQTMNKSEADIQIYDGTYNTTTNSTLVETPFGDLHPVTIATMYLNTGQGNGALYHEYFQGDGFSQGGSGIGGSNSPETGPTTEDQACIRIDYTHWVENVYTANPATHFDLNKLSETLDNKSPEFKASQSNSLGVDVNHSNK